LPLNHLWPWNFRFLFSSRLFPFTFSATLVFSAAFIRGTAAGGYGRGSGIEIIAGAIPAEDDIIKG
jgi:hypothetical protein